MAYIYDLSDTWNASGTTFFGIKMNVTNTASASGSKLLSLQVASTEYFGVDKDGSVTIGNGGDLRLSSATGGDPSIIYNDAEDLYFNTNGAVRAVINSSGNVGIGTSSPVSKLHVNSATAVAAYTTTGNSIGGTVIGVNAAGASIVGTYASNNLIFGNYNSGGTFAEFGRFDSSGNVLIGTTSTFDNVSYLKFQSLGGVSTKIGGTSLTSQMSFFNDNGRVGWIGTDGTTTSYNTSSDSRLKHDIVDAPEASSLIDAIKVRSFKWNADNSEQRYGFIAQELIEVAPEAVSAPDEEDQMMAVDYSKLVPMLIKEVQSLRVRVAELEGK